MQGSETQWKLSWTSVIVSTCFQFAWTLIQKQLSTNVNDLNNFLHGHFLTRADASDVTETGARGPNKWSGAFRVSCTHVLASQPSHTCGVSFNLQWNIQALLNNSVMLSEQPGQRATS